MNNAVLLLFLLSVELLAGRSDVMAELDGSLPSGSAQLPAVRAPDETTPPPLADAQVAPATSADAVRTVSDPATATAAAATRILPGRDEADVPELRHVRQAVLRAAAARSVPALARLMGPEVQWDFESPMTPDAFVAFAAEWTPDSRAEFWRDVEDAARLPMAACCGGFIAPYVFMKMGGYDVDRLAIVGHRVALRAAPSRTARTIEYLSYDVVTCVPDGSAVRTYVRQDGEPRGWYEVTTPSGARGWVFERYARHAIDMRLHFRRIDGRWRLVAIIAGD